jgi:ubiquinone/menaquinone biosynthesis C-methylase UbiE
LLIGCKDSIFITQIQKELGAFQIVLYFCSMKTHENLATAYDAQYASGASLWRETGAKYKALNIQQVTKGKKFAQILEVGAGDGAVLANLERLHIATSLSAVEISSSGVQTIQQRNLQTLQDLQLFDGYKLPYPDQSFEAVVCTHVIEHVEHPRLLLREIKRVSKYQIFEVPIDFSWQVDKKVAHFLGYGHINIFTPATFRFLLLSEGFEILQDLHTTISYELWQLEAGIQKENMKQKPMQYYAWYAMRTLKRWVWSVLPTQQRNKKPNAYTVFCQASKENIKIF